MQFTLKTALHCTGWRAAWLKPALQRDPQRGVAVLEIYRPLYYRDEALSCIFYLFINYYCVFVIPFLPFVLTVNVVLTPVFVVVFLAATLTFDAVLLIVLAVFLFVLLAVTILSRVVLQVSADALLLFSAMFDAVTRFAERLTETGRMLPASSSCAR